MNSTTLAFIFGCILILIGIIGGGFEIKDLKIPKVGWPPRMISTIVGVTFIVLGLHPDEKLLLKPQQTMQPAQPLATPERINKQPPQVPPPSPSIHQKTNGPNSPAINGVQGNVIINH